MPTCSTSRRPPPDHHPRHGSLIQELEDLQVIYGQGPCIDAVQSGSPVLAPDLANHHTRSWQTYADQALARGVRAVFAFPLQTDTAQLGALVLYRLTPGPLDAQQTDDAMLLTQIAARAMLAQKDRIHLDGAVSALHWLTAAHRLTPDSGTLPVTRGRAVDLGLTVEQALAPPWGEPAGDRFDAGRWLSQSEPPGNDQ